MFRKYYDAAATETKGGTEIILKKLGEIDEKQKTQIDNLKTEVKKDMAGLEDEIGKTKGMIAKTGEEVEDLKKTIATKGMTSGSQKKSFSENLEDRLMEHKADLPLKVGKKFSIEMDTKVVGNLSSAGSLTGSYFVAPQVVPGVFVQPYNETHLRDILPIGNTGSNLIRYVRDNGGQGGPTTVAEGATKPQMDRALSIQDAPVRKIATYLRVPDEMIEDIPYLTTFLTNVGTQEVLAVGGYANPLW
jgi:HK97 family phage major capsid protein